MKHLSFFTKLWHAVRKNPWRVTAVVIVAALGVALFVRHATIIMPANGGTFTEGTVGTLSIVNPVLATTEADKQVTRLVFSSLKDLMTTSSVSYTKTQQVWHVTLRSDVRWHDGQPVMPEDVLFTVHAIQDPAARSPRAATWSSVHAERTGEHELSFTAPRSYGYFGTTLLALQPVPLHVYQPLTYAAWADNDHALAPVGSGPFRFLKENTPAGSDMITSYELSAATTTPADLAPHIHGFVWRFFPSTDELVRQFNRGELDGMVVLDPDARAAVHASHETTAFTLQNYYAIFTNPSKNEALRDVRVRAALQATLHKEDLLAIVPGSTWFINDDTGDPATLLTAAGWKKQDNGGWEKPLGKNSHDVTSLRLTLTVPDVPFLKHTADAARSRWETLGVPTKIDVVPVSTLATDTIPNRTYELLLYGNILSPSYDLFPFWHSSERFSPGLNLSLYKSARMDALVDAIRAATTDTDRERLFNEAKTQLATDLPALFLYQTPYTYFTSPRVHGVSGTMIDESADRFATVRDWYVATHRVWK